MSAPDSPTSETVTISTVRYLSLLECVAALKAVCSWPTTDIPRFVSDTAENALATWDAFK